MSDSLAEIRTMLAKHSMWLLSKQNVVATGIGYKTIKGIRTTDHCIICSVEEKMKASLLAENQRIPPFVDGIPTDVHPVGLIRSLKLPTEKFRPVPGGVSIGHIQITAGTLGCLVKKGGTTYILSNNHVLANSNTGQPGDMIIQPGVYDGGVLTDQIASLSEYITINFENEKVTSAFSPILNFLSRLTGNHKQKVLPDNLVDCAIAEPWDQTDFTNEIYKVGQIRGITEGRLGMRVKKSGRTTGLTTGSIEQLDVTVRVNFGNNKTALFKDQLIAGAMSQGGDSGSVVLEDNDMVIGLLFAGSANTTIINRFQNVIQLLDVTLA